jgi:hypothetical protein
MFYSIFRKFVENIQVSLKSGKINVTLCADRYTFMIMSRSVHLRMRNVSDRFLGKTKTHSVANNFLFFENRAFREIMWKIFFVM